MKRFIRIHILRVEANPDGELIKDLVRLDEKLLELDRAAEISDDLLRSKFSSFHMAFPKDLPPDPYSDEYRQKQFELYEKIAGKPYSLSNEEIPIDEKVDTTHPYPYNTQSPTTVGNQLIGMGHLIRNLAVPPGGRILEFGPGWGNTTQILALMGYQVTAVDIAANFIRLIRERMRRAGLDNVEVVQDDFSFCSRVTQPYDAIVFYASFHHASDHLRLIQSFDRAVKRDGLVMFAAEPIVDGYPIPWGLRMDGEALRAIRRCGWLELGFDESYFRNALARQGWFVRKLVSRESTPLALNFIARRIESATPRSG
jgi:2-polyprenyl-3-methyl-5-hydroxy-6-metoxy-1,4-benzoquinol methylase